jgi:hypothetical protein
MSLVANPNCVSAQLDWKYSGEGQGGMDLLLKEAPCRASHHVAEEPHSAAVDKTSPWNSEKAKGHIKGRR